MYQSLFVYLTLSVRGLLKQKKKKFKQKNVRRIKTKSVNLKKKKNFLSQNAQDQSKPPLK